MQIYQLQPLTFSLNGAPTGASITLAGVFTWTPATAGSYTFDVRVSDGNGGTDSETITVTVTSTSPNVIPVVNAGPDKNVTKGLPFVSSGSFTDPDADTWTATVNYGDSTGTTNLALYTNKTFAFIHTYTSTGQFTVRVNVTDNKGGKGTDIANVTVNAYAFDGFYQPIDMGVTNSANAGKTIPTKWHLSNVSGDVADPASFIALKSIAITCNQLTPMTDAIEEYSESNSGLQYLGKW